MPCNDLFTFILKIGNIAKQLHLKCVKKICNICCYETMVFMWTLQQSEKKNQNFKIYVALQNRGYGDFAPILECRTHSVKCD